MMRKSPRLEELVKLVDRAGTLSVEEIVECMKVSDATVRRDLIELES